ncbi:MAG: sulfatase-like hydrolase/transferase [Pseudomonadales bacterium]|nr:sulfatase-like hydrolase/transferase [Pseudomonadales bacterium]
MTRPNILIFQPDQLRADCLGCFGNPTIQTPHIDALAERGLRFNNAWANHPVCGPSRVSLMTGWYPHVRGHRTLTHLLEPEDPNLLKYLKNAGYQVAWAGARGDVFAPGVTEASTHFCGFTTRIEKMSMGPTYPEGHKLYDAFYHGKRPGETWIDFDEAATQTAIDWLTNEPDGPWCLWLPLMFPHLPFEVEEPWYSQYKPADMPERIKTKGNGKPAFHEALRGKSGTDRLDETEWQEIQSVYYGMISRLDWQLGRVVETLKAIDQFDNTLILFFTDHGEYLGDFGLVEKWPAGLDRCLLQNPLIIAGPGVSAGGVAETFTEMIDILPTLLDVAEIQANHTHFGHSLRPVFKDPQHAIRQAAFSEGGFSREEQHLFETPTGEYAKKGALQREQPDVVGKAYCVRTSEHTYVYRLYERDELYERVTDPYETNNLLAENPDHSAAVPLKSMLLDWLAATTDVIPWEAHPRFPRIPHGQHEQFAVKDSRRYEP